MSYDNNLTGALFKNAKKETEKHPDYKGQAEIEGTEYWVSAWLNTSGKGVKYLSLKFNAKDEQKPSKPKPADLGDDLDEGVPF